MPPHSQKLARSRAITRSLERLERHKARLLQLDRRFFWLRLGALVGGGLLVFLAYLSRQDRLILVALAISIAVFSTVVFFHRRLDGSLLRARLSHRYWTAQRARMDLDWDAIPAPPASAGSPDARHPFGSDLNLAGRRSVHHLLDTAISQGGSQRLLAWLLDPLPDPQRISTRQGLLGEILPLTGFRSRLAISGALAGTQPGERWDGEALISWLDQQGEARPLTRVLAALGVLSLLNIALFLLNAFAGLPPYFIVTFVLYVAIYYSQARTVGEVFEQAQHLGASLEKFRLVLVFLERYPYRTGSWLAHLAAPFQDKENRPSRLLRSLGWIVSAASLQGNPLVWLAINALLPWDIYFAHRLRLARRAVAGLLPAWLDAWYELEALDSLANFAYLNPGYSFPHVLSPGTIEEPVFTALQLGHPLIPDANKVSNDFTLRRLGEVTIITGSNMSGKSTFLRTLGVNLALAYAGSVVDAESLSILPFRLFTCISLSDSLTDGISYFYAEVRRLKALLDELQRADLPPLFFLIDEIFRGTNNRERQIGSRAYVQALVGGRGAGAISTHDLELVRLAGELAGVYNYHFREEVSDGRMVFDYRLHPGPSPTTNALKIMQLEGLPISTAPDS